MKKGERKSYLLRINGELWDSLNEWAAQEFRSVNGQIELILQNAVNDRKKKAKKEAKEND
ncbi:MAG: DNA-binding protein [Dehalococcoidales bacterium]